MLDFLAELARQYAALFFSACALYLTISQARATRKHNRLTVRPQLTSFTETKPDPERNGIVIIKATLSNSGLGPAIIKTFKPLLDGVPLTIKKPEDLLPVAEKALPVHLIAEGCQFTVLRQGYVMAKDEVVTLVKLSFASTVHDDPKTLERALDRFHIRVTYESAYEESFVYDSRDHRRQV
jgi:hypothetical protein